MRTILFRKLLSSSMRSCPQAVSVGCRDLKEKWVDTPGVFMKDGLTVRESEGMGLDGVEIILRAEELFGIEINDEEAGTIEMVGQVYELICSTLISPLCDLRPRRVCSLSSRIARRHFCFLAATLLCPLLLRYCRGRLRVSGIA